MNKKTIVVGKEKIIVFNSASKIIVDGQSAMDLLATVHYVDECDRIAINREAIIDDFFVLSSGVAGEVLQKVVNFRKKIAIIGDFSTYTSKPLHDFIYEGNNGRSVFFVKTEQEAIDKLSG